MPCSSGLIATVNHQPPYSFPASTISRAPGYQALLHRYFADLSGCWHAFKLCCCCTGVGVPSACSKAACIHLHSSDRQKGVICRQACNHTQSHHESCYTTCLQIKNTASAAYSCFELYAPDVLCLDRQLKSPLRDSSSSSSPSSSLSSSSSSSRCTATGQPTGLALLHLAGRECAALLDPTARTTAFWRHFAAPTRQVPQQPSARSDPGIDVC